MLAYDPSERASAAQCLKHNWLNQPTTQPSTSSIIKINELPLIQTNITNGNNADNEEDGNFLNLLGQKNDDGSVFITPPREEMFGVKVNHTI